MSDWTGLCEREWEQGGEVIAVTLTRGSAQELAGDALSAASLGEVEFFDRDGGPLDGPPPGACGARIGQLLNVAAGRKVVEYTPLADADTVTVRDSDGQTRTVAIGAPVIAGRVTIEWPNADRCAPGPLKGTTVVRDAATGEPLRALSVTVTTLAGGPVVADVTHPANDGKALLSEADGYRDYPWTLEHIVAGDRDRFPGEIAVRRYEVTRMTETPPVEEWTAQVSGAALRAFFRRVREDGGTVESLALTAGDMKELVYGPPPHGLLLGDLIGAYTENGVTLPERVASTRVTVARNPAAAGAEVPVRLAAEGQEASALVRYGPDGHARAVAIVPAGI